MTDQPHRPHWHRPGSFAEQMAQISGDWSRSAEASDFQPMPTSPDDRNPWRTPAGPGHIHVDVDADWLRRTTRRKHGWFFHRAIVGDRASASIDVDLHLWGLGGQVKARAVGFVIVDLLCVRLTVEWGTPWP